MAYGRCFVKKEWISLSETLTAGHSSETGLYEVEILWSFSGLGKEIILEFFHNWGIYLQKVTQMSQVIKCKRSEVFEVDIAKAIRIECSRGFALCNGLFSLLGKKLGYQKEKVWKFAFCFPETLSEV